MMDFLYTMNQEQLILLGIAVLMFILFWILEKSFIQAIFSIIGTAILAIIVSLIVSYFFADEIAVIAFIVTIIIVIANKAINRVIEAKKRKAFFTCEECGEKDALQYVNTTEEDRYISSKEVSEKTAKGNYKTRHVKCTKVVEKDHYECKFCGAGYSTKHTRELS